MSVSISRLHEKNMHQNEEKQASLISLFSVGGGGGVGSRVATYSLDNKGA